METYQIPKIALKMQTICTKNQNRITLSGVRFEHGLIQATDGHRLVIHKDDTNADLPDKASWKFSGQKPKKHNLPNYDFEVGENSQAYDKTGKGGGNATVLDLDGLTCPKTSQVLPKNLENRVYITLDAKYLYEMAKVMSDTNTVTLAIGRQYDGIVITNDEDSSTLGILMPKWAGRANDLEVAKNSAVKTLNNIKAQFTA